MLEYDPSIQERLVRYLKNRPGVWVAKGTMEDLAREKAGVIGETVGRRLRILAEVTGWTKQLAERTSPEHVRALELLEGGVVEVEHREKNHAWYRYQPPANRVVRKVRFEGDRAIEYYETVSTATASTATVGEG